MAISFPSSPALNDTFTAANRTWYWNGYAWKAQGTVTGVVNATSPVTYDALTKTVALDRTAENAVNDTRYALVSDSEIIPLDNLYYKFDGIENRFKATYNGQTVPVTNPWKLQVIVNGVFQSLSFPEYVWQSGLPQDGFMVDSDGYIAFTEPVPAGSTFDGRMMPGPATTSRQITYPFKAADILLGA